MADLVITGALDTEHIGDLIFAPVTEAHNPGTIDTINITAQTGDATATADPSNPLVYTIDGVSATDSVIEFTIDMQEGADVRNFVVELHLTGMAAGTASVGAEFANVRLKA